MHGAHRWPFALAGVVIAAVAVLGKMQFDWIARLSESHEHPPTLLVMQIDSAYLVHDLIPDLARRFFGAEFDVAVARGDQIVFRSDAHWPASVAGADSDVTAPLFWLRRREREERPHSPAPLPPPLWRLLVRHHGAPLAQVVAAERHRDMALASLILALLAAVAVALALAARR